MLDVSDVAAAPAAARWSGGYGFAVLRVAVPWLCNKSCRLELVIVKPRPASHLCEVALHCGHTTKKTMFFVPGYRAKL